LQAGQEFDQAASAYAGAGDALMAAEMKNNQSVALLLSGECAGCPGCDRRPPKRYLPILGIPGVKGMSLANQASALQAQRLKDSMECYQGRRCPGKGW